MLVLGQNLSAALVNKLWFSISFLMVHLQNDFGSGLVNASNVKKEVMRVVV